MIKTNIITGTISTRFEHSTKSKKNEFVGENEMLLDIDNYQLEETWVWDLVIHCCSLDDILTESLIQYSCFS